MNISTRLYRYNMMILLVLGALGCSQPSQPDSNKRISNKEDVSTNAGHDLPDSFGFGREVSAKEIDLWDTDVSPNGSGLPPGISGTAIKGEPVYLAKCAICHGKNGYEGPFNKLVTTSKQDDFNFANDRKLVKTIGNYWPYATTLYDYINRSMPQTEPGTLTPHEVYSLVAFLLYRNNVIKKDEILNAETLPLVKMPAMDRFVVDDRKGGPEVR